MTRHEYVSSRAAHPSVRRGLVFALRSNGVTYREIAAVLGISESRVKQLDERAWKIIYRLADRGFPRAPDWNARRNLVWCYRESPYYARWAMRPSP